MDTKKDEETGESAISDEERKRRAEEMILKISSMMGLGEDDYDSEEEVNESDKFGPL